MIKSAQRVAWGLGLLFGLLSIPLTATSESVYKCVDAQGKVTFSQRPCGDNAQEVQVRTTPAAEDAGDRLADTIDQHEELSRRLNAQSIEEQLRRREQELDSLSIARDRKDAEFERLYAEAVAKDPRNYTLQRSIMTRQNAMRSEYDTKISKAQRDVSRLQSELYRAR